VTLPAPEQVATATAGRARLAPDHPLLAQARVQIEEYLAGKRREFTLFYTLGGLTDFQQAALRATASIPYGETRTYGWVAAQAGNGRAPRAAGQALHCNPLPLVVPCHRVLGAGGSLTGFGGGLEMKRRLLELERTVRGTGG